MEKELFLDVNFEVSEFNTISSILDKLKIEGWEMVEEKVFKVKHRFSSEITSKKYKFKRSVHLN